MTSVHSLPGQHVIHTWPGHAPSSKNFRLSSRGWWKLSSTLLRRAGAKESIPPLKRHDDTWALTAEERASELARVFRSKSCLPVRDENEYTELFPPTRPDDPAASAFNIYGAHLAA